MKKITLRMGRRLVFLKHVDRREIISRVKVPRRYMCIRGRQGLGSISNVWL